MLRPMRLLLCASAAALILGAGPGGDFAIVAPAHAQADVVIAASMAPPPLPVYSQPPIPGVGFIWIPGYWAWDGQEYYWVPGYWAMPPAADLLWTPGYWGWDDADNDYVFLGYPFNRTGRFVSKGDSTKVAPSWADVRVVSAAWEEQPLGSGS